MKYVRFYLIALAVGVGYWILVSLFALLGDALGIEQIEPWGSIIAFILVFVGAIMYVNWNMKRR